MSWSDHDDIDTDTKLETIMMGVVWVAIGNVFNTVLLLIILLK